jgi:predicted flap endonuclease-1-like 5' DNA nuclease
MLALGLQTLLLMSAAYCLGAVLACFVRRSFFSRLSAPLRAERRVEPLPQADADVVGAKRFVPAATPAETSPRPAPPAVGAVADAQLERIYAIDAATAAALKKLGVQRYDEISRWQRGDLERVAQALAIRRQRISRENWIEQAQILASGGETHYARRWARGEIASATPTADQGERRQTMAAAARAAAPRPGPARVAAGRPAPAAGSVGTALAPPKVSERAAFARGEPAVTSSTGRQAPAAAPVARPALGRAGPAQGLITPSPLEAAKPVSPPQTAADNLQRIRGLDAALARRLAAAGITRYGQIAAWSAPEVEQFERQLETAAGRIARENWIEQAQILSRGGDTVFSRAFDRGAPAEPPAVAAVARADQASRPEAARAAPPRPVSLGALRSVRSQAYQNPEPGPEAAYRVGSHNRVVRSPPAQDLKRIRGIGVLIERRLNAMQIVSYEQIANWTAEDIERVSRTLDFKGRIERENWVEQARILASGGATEFSRRVDRGDVETGRYRS